MTRRVAGRLARPLAPGSPGCRGAAPGGGAGVGARAGVAASPVPGGVAPEGPDLARRTSGAATGAHRAGRNWRFDLPLAPPSTASVRPVPHLCFCCRAASPPARASAVGPGPLARRRQVGPRPPPQTAGLEAAWKVGDAFLRSARLPASQERLDLLAFTTSNSC